MASSPQTAPPHDEGSPPADASTPPPSPDHSSPPPPPQSSPPPPPPPPTQSPPPPPPPDSSNTPPPASPSPPPPTSSPPPPQPSSPPPPDSAPPAPPTSSPSPPPPTTSNPPPAVNSPPVPPPAPRQSPPSDNPTGPPSPPSSIPPPPSLNPNSPPAAPNTPPPPLPSPGSPPFSPPPPNAPLLPSPPLSQPQLTPLPSTSPNTTSTISSSSPNHHSPPPSNFVTIHTSIVAGSVAGGVAIVAILIVCLVCSRRKKKPNYYTDPGHQPKGGDQYYFGTPQPMDHVVKVSPSLRGLTPSTIPLTNSSDFSSGYSGQHLTPLQPQSPNMASIGAKSQFTYDELATATDGFSQSNLLGQGGFGFVHKGVLPDGKEVAVKSLKAGSGQGEREFQAEVEIISRVHHRHLVSLVGYCIADGQRMLVYEFVQNKTLEFHLHGKGQSVMDWQTRLRIAVGSAKGLAYLHEDCHPRIIHRDIKAANILIDLNFEAMVADFGLAKLTSDNNTHVSTRVMGTFGYLAPEYASSGKLSEKSDVFSFGVMLLELITGRRPVDLTNKIMEDSLVDWARPLLTKALDDGNYGALVDPRLEDNYVPQELSRMASCAAASIRHSARRRPKMSQIVRALDGDSSLDDLNEGVKPGQSAAYNPNGTGGVYDTRAYDADMVKFRKMVMSSGEFNSSEYGATSEYGLNPSSSINNSKEMNKISSQK